MTGVRNYRMTICTARFWYSPEAGVVQGFEMHYKVARKGAILNIRHQLTKRGVRHYQQNFYRRFKRWIPKRNVKIRFEREHPTSRIKSERTIHIQRRIMEFIGKRMTATRLRPLELSYTPKRRKRRKRKKNARGRPVKSG